MQNLNILRTTSTSGISQIRGINRSGATGAGIPQHVTNVSTSMANASAGSTSTISVTFRRDPTDVNFNGVTVWVKGYQGNQTPTQVASGTDSPINFILNNTGEALSVTVQANGNGGSAPITTAPTAGLTLPRSTSGGAGTTTTTSGPTLKTNGTSNSSQSTLNLKNGNAIAITSGAGGDETIALTSANIAIAVPAELTVSGSPVTNGAGGTITIGKATETANTVWAGPTSGAAAQPTFRQLGRTDLVVVPQIWSYGARYHGNGTSTAAVTTAGGPAATFATSAATTARVAATANDNPLITAGMGALASLNAFGMELDSGSISSGIVRGTLQRYSCRVRHDQTTNCRYWVGLVASGSGPAGSATGLATDTPNFAVAAFRYSSTTDTTYKAVLATSSANLTATDTTVAVDTSKTKLFEITYDGTNWNFWIDSVLKVTTNTNTPANTTLLNGVYSADNKNSANTATASFNWMLISHS
jgi:hypothetical protein